MQHLFEHRRLLEKTLVFGRGAVTHDLLHAGAVVPAAIEQRDFAGCRQVRHIALKIPLRALAFGGFGQRHHVRLARVERLGNGVDGAALAGRVAAFEYHDHALAGVLQPVRQIVQLDLQGLERGFVVFLFHVDSDPMGRADGRNNAAIVRAGVLFANRNPGQPVCRADHGGFGHSFHYNSP